jgi:hypothetical protein
MGVISCLIGGSLKGGSRTGVVARGGFIVGAGSSSTLEVVVVSSLELLVFSIRQRVCKGSIWLWFAHC